MGDVNLLGLVSLTGLLIILAACRVKVRYPNAAVLQQFSPAPDMARQKPVLGSASLREFSAGGFLRDGSVMFRHSQEQPGFDDCCCVAVNPDGAANTALMQALRSDHLLGGRGTSDYLVTGTVNHLEAVGQDRDVLIRNGLSAELLDASTGDLLWRDVSSETNGLQHMPFQTSLPERLKQPNRLSCIWLRPCRIGYCRLPHRPTSGTPGNDDFKRCLSCSNLL
jgi:hypothetical protein